ncbi:Alpha/Beta hydrolase protein [Microdochium trichocladiopsis]|uniref:Alpha/Beta hydrolase protein n=1 Tax=Microdochium trichocladiopsis TaxID=1682393 RepID=A0A9P8XU13_9PEZI|nr:Alpha/Beta hydrolase protein [Microdochium trichocladiopsis]KAH7018098.1 Alpha/Beta hydrolase protein [Microdochium trichocladiopsis]
MGLTSYRLASAALAALAGSAVAELSVTIGSSNNVLTGPVDGRVVLIFAPKDTDPLDDIDVTSSPNKMYGKNVAAFGPSDTVTLAGGDVNGTATGVYGWPLVSLDEVEPGTYNVQAFLSPYDTATRADGSQVRLKFPCGDGAPNVNGVGSLKTTTVEVDVTGSDQTITLAFDDIEPPSTSSGSEIGSCYQGNYEDTELLKFVKIRSEKLSAFWGRDMYVGANVLLPKGYDADDKSVRYPVIYAQDHWDADSGAFGYPNSAAFTSAWDNGIIPGTNGNPDRPTPKLIMIKFRHESPFYDDSYAVNTANIGPYGDAINEELIPHLDSLFNTIAEPYARIQEGGSTGGWVSAASLIFRPDLFGACFSYYPDSLDFHRHQDIQLYTNANAYVNADGSAIPSIQTHDSAGNQQILATVAQENHWELVFGTASRSFLQWDVWNSVFGVQGLNGYPLEPWDKVTGEIYPESVEYWKSFDLANYITTNWAGAKNLGEALKDRIHISVGTWDNYFLNEGVVEFQSRVDALGGEGWANVTILANRTHGGLYERRETWNYIELLDKWISDHAPDGPTPLAPAATSPSTRGNVFADVIANGGRGAALARQADPVVTVKQAKVKCGASVSGTLGRWDPGVKLTAQWLVDGEPSGAAFAVAQGQTVRFAPTTAPTSDFEVQLAVTGVKRNYVDETRVSEAAVVQAARRR